MVVTRGYKDGLQPESLADGKLAGETKMVGLLYGCTERHAFGCILNLCGRA